MEFDELFVKATKNEGGGREPFPYQTCLAMGSHLPWLLHVPTGAGKTAAVVLGWLFRRRFHPDEDVRVATPRRLVYCLPMRTLVEQTVASVRGWLQALGDDADGIEVYQLMGGEIDRDWDRYPARDALLVGTQDQLLSRALNRGYAMSRYRWPMHFALINSDVLWVMDEVQLMGPGLKTTAQLQAFREAFATYGPAASLWMSATMQAGDVNTVDFSPDDAALAQRTLALLAEDDEHPVLAQRMQAAKPLVKATLALTPSSRKTYPKALAEMVRKAHKPGSLTLVILNQVRRAQETFLAVKKLHGGSGPELLLLHSRFRPAERGAVSERLRQAVPPDGPGRIVVATQAIEAGVDISARTLVTELAPWSSLVQRFGRCNRFGEFGADAPAQVCWVDIASDKRADLQPYEEAEIAAARQALEGLEDVGIRAVQGIHAAGTEQVTQVLRRRDILDLFDTTPDLAGNDLDVSPFIRDADDLDVQVFWREFEGQPSADQHEPQPDELCAVRLPVFRAFMEKLRKDGSGPWVWDALAKRWAFLEPHQLRPGLAVLLHASMGGYEPVLGWWEDGRKASTVPPAKTPEVGAKEAEGYSSDPTTRLGRFITLAEHTDHVVAHLEALLAGFPELPPQVVAALLLAARWHDAGKAHPAFQSMLTAALPENDPRRDGTAWAKAPKSPGEDTNERKFFRHELASALAMLPGGLPDLAAYIAASHHGKTRLSIRSMPGERPPDDRPGARVARGIVEGDVLPATDLGGGTAMPETTLSLVSMEMGESDAGQSWLARVLALRDALGPFRLAWLETMLRVADWRASEEEACLNE